MMDFGRYGGYGSGMWWGGGFMLVGLLCLVFFIALIVWIVRMATGRGYGMGCGMHGMHDDRDLMHGKQDEALDILRHRFAAGDITKEEYEERVKVLNGGK